MAVAQWRTPWLALNPGFPFRILSCRKILQSCETKSGTESLGSRLPHDHVRLYRWVKLSGQSTGSSSLGTWDSTQSYSNCWLFPFLSVYPTAPNMFLFSAEARYYKAYQNMHVFIQWMENDLICVAALSTCAAGKVWCDISGRPKWWFDAVEMAVHQWKATQTCEYYKSA